MLSRLLAVSALATVVGTKADTSTTYTKAAVDTLLLGKTDDAELTTAVSVLNASINTVSTAVAAVGTTFAGKANSADVFLKTAT